MERDHIVLDTNVLLMSIAPDSKYNKVWRSFLEGQYILCVSNEMLEEYSEVMSRNINSRVSDYIMQVILMRENVLLYDPHFRCELIETDKDDNKFVDCAFASNAKFIVTEDHHFNILKTISFPRIEIIGIEDFCEQL